MHTDMPKPADINIKIYQQVLNRSLEKFPRNFWKEEYNSSPAIVRYLIEEVLQWDDEDIKTKFGTKIIRQYKLAGMLKYVYYKRLFDMMDDAYPGKFHPWELQSSPNGFWRDVGNCIDATRWLINEKLKWSKEDIIKHYNVNSFKENGFTGLLKWGWNGETYRAITLSFPEYDLKPWDLLSVRITNLSKDEAIPVLRWYIEDKMNWSEAELRDNWRVRNLKDDGILRIIKNLFNNHMFEAIDAAYPNRFKRWEFPVPNGFWTLERAKEALRWLVIEKLNIEPKDALKKLPDEEIQKYNLRGMLDIGFQSGLKEAIKQTFHM